MPSSRSVRLAALAEHGRGANNFDVLRLFGAFAVLFGHCFVLTGNTEPFPDRTLGSWGSLGVTVFFSISGFLVARSWAADPRVLAFAAKRALRLLPALVVCLLLTALVLGPLVTTVDTKAYLQDPGTEAYVLANATLQTNYALPGVFADTIYPGAVNGSLWTLPLEVKAYALVLVLGLLGLFGRRWWAMPVVTVLVALLLVVSIRNALPGGDRAVAALADLQSATGGRLTAAAGGYRQWAEPFAAFAVGAGLFAVGRWVPLSWILVALAAGAYGVALLIGGAVPPTAFTLLIPYVVLVLAYRTDHLLHLPRRMGDYSYGLYIYAFVVQQTVSHLLAPTSAWVMLGLTTPLALLLAVASWHLIEAPALALKGAVIRMPAPSSVTPP